MNARQALTTPPWSCEAEQSVLGALFLDNTAYDRVGDLLTPADFFDHRHALIWSAAAGEILANRPVDAITVFEALQRSSRFDEAGGLEYLGQLTQSVPSVANVRRHAQIVREHSVRRALIQTADEAAGLAAAGGELDETIDRITTMFGALQRGQVSKMPRAIADIVLERTQHYAELESGAAVAGWATQIPAFNRWTNGGLRAGGLYILGARPAVGKSSFGQSIGTHMARKGLATLFLSLEMPETEVSDRGVSGVGRVSSSALLSGKMSGDDWGRVAEAAEEFARLPFFIDDQPALTLRDIRIKAKSVKGLKVLILDYLQLCSGSRRDGNRNSEIEELTRGLKALAKELGIAIVALSQLNRDVEKRAGNRPNLSDLRDSGAIEQDADVVMFLWPVREFEGEGRKIVGLGVDKNRQGRLGSVGLDFYGDTQRWAESTADISPPTATRRAPKDDL